MDIRTSTILLRNDASAAISAFRKGSFASPQLQAAATMLNDARAKLDVITPLLHVPGLTLVQEGIDGASRHGAAFGHGSWAAFALQLHACIDRVAGQIETGDVHTCCIAIEVNDRAGAIGHDGHAGGVAGVAGVVWFGPFGGL